MRKIVYRKVGWRKYLIPNQREWINDYMQTHGVEFYTKGRRPNQSTWKYNRKEFVLAKFLRTNICITIQRHEYELAMKYCMLWLEKNEEYEYCAIVRDYLKERKGEFRKRTPLEEIHALLS